MEEDLAALGKKIEAADKTVILSLLK
jgi:hypothetical protein